MFFYRVWSLSPLWLQVFETRVLARFFP